MKNNLKPIKCWGCLYLGKCNNCNENGCEEFTQWHYPLWEIAKMLNVNFNTLSCKFIKNDAKVLKMINEKLNPLKFKVEKVDGRKYIVRVK